jgi:beta-lactam-binding protein with PASTA domain/tRNA A-37 threonylcarbamoyl transferase component Bud32
MPHRAFPIGGSAISRSTIPKRPGDRSELAFALRTLDGRYHVVDRIAAGGMGEVFRAHDAVLDREVAIKVLHRQLASDHGFVERFRREARAAAGLSHPNIVNVHDWGAVDGIYYMVMEFVRGTSTRDLLNEEGLLAPAQAADILLQTLSALDHAHRKGIVHRDIKPENVMVTREGVVKVADFGLARAYADAQITDAGSVTGTVQYLSPEQLQGEPADPRTDLYALGIVAFELVTGRLPFSGETPMAIAYKHIHERVPRPSVLNPAVPASLDGWVSSMTEKQRELRPESAAEARRDLEAESRSLPVAEPVASLVPDVAVIPPPVDAKRATTVTIPQPGRVTHRRRRKLRWALGILLVLGLLAGGAYAAWTYLVPHETSVPSVVGLPVKEAQRRLEDANLVVRLAKGEYSPTIVQGIVLQVRPDEGATLAEGDRVTLVPSLGHAPVTVPDVIGKSLAKAKDQLREADLRTGKVSHAYSDRFTAGQVMRQSAAPDSDAPYQSEVRLVISDGPAPVPIPNVVGKNAATATATLEGLGFVVNRSEDYSDDVAADKVLSQDPSEGDLQPGKSVSITVSLGPPVVQVPSFVGMTKDAAVAKIQELGLTASVIELPGATGELTVASQLPLAGRTVHVGTPVTIYVA